MRVLSVIGLLIASGGCGIPDEHFEGIDQSAPTVRLISPGMVAVNRQQPTLRWELDGGLTMPQLNLCNNHACNGVSTPAALYASDGLSAVPSSPLPGGVVYWRITALPPTGVTRVQSRVWEFWNGVPLSTNQVPSTASKPIFDVNGDGRADVVTGAPSSGIATVLLGGDGGAGAGGTDLMMPNGAATSYGGAVSDIGDINGDSYSDFAVAAVGEAGGGVVHVYLGSGAPDGSTWLSSPVLHIDLGPPASDAGTGGFGTSVASAGDINGDGYADFLVGNGHQTFVFLGSESPSAMAWQDPSSSLRLDIGAGGGAIGGVGDINGDGFSDFAVSSSAGVTIYLGSNMPSAAGWSSGVQRVDLTNPGTMGVFGFSVGAAGDVNGDGYADFIIGSTTATGASPPGEAHLYLGSGAPSATSWNAASSTARVDLVSPDGTAAGFGYSVATAGDVNRDGYADFVIGAARAAGNGTAHVYLGSANPSATAWNGATPTARIDLTNPSGITGFGAMTTSIGDFDGDGYSDFAVGTRSGNAGQIHIYRGSGAPSADDWNTTAQHRIDTGRSDLGAIARTGGGSPPTH